MQKYKFVRKKYNLLVWNELYSTILHILHKSDCTNILTVGTFPVDLNSYSDGKEEKQVNNLSLLLCNEPITILLIPRLNFIEIKLNEILFK